MKRIFLRLKQPLRNERGEITFFACFFVVGIVMLISFLLLYASIRITCINIRNGAKMELNNLSGTIYADTYRSQRETNFEEYLNTLYSSNDYTDMLEATVAGGLDSKIPLSTEDYKVSDISLEFNVEDGRVEYIFYCDVEFYVRMFGHSYPAKPGGKIALYAVFCSGHNFTPLLHLKLDTILALCPFTIQLQFYRICPWDLIPHSRKADQMVFVPPV